jgi:hypothetical protein
VAEPVYVLATGIVMLILFVIVRGFGIEEGTPFHQWAGLLQRILVAIRTGIPAIGPPFVSLISPRIGGVR